MAAAGRGRSISRCTTWPPRSGRARWPSQLRAALPRLGECHVAELGPVIGAHLGPGVLGTVVVRR